MSNTGRMGHENEPAVSSRTWNFHPNLPISMSPVFDIPPKPKATLKWLLGTWLKVTPPVNHLLFALVAYWFLWPSLAVMQVFSADWVAQIFIINFSATLILGTVISSATAALKRCRSIGGLAASTMVRQLRPNVYVLARS